MAKNKKENKSSKKKTRVHKDLEGFEIKVNQQGEIMSNYSIDQINEFLNKNVEDKKLVKRDAAEKAKKEEEEFHIEEGEEVEETDEDFVKGTSSVSDDEDDKDLPKARRKKGRGDEDEDDEED
ncbi:hypothetical protein I0P70_08065 [Pontibacter sp. FD36]|uniref:Uncharacterized protein n=1 Tax=Pontibacter lucknowensis TaxID=1077936 RepID=A0A1N6ULM6_9BACT|nr:MULTISPECIES: hypothetical protein [Pontibacter]EJF09047.1 hypothetical protein O71_17326 [Pontibacter sp. BAB1700]MBF8963195.1 hypothetical protein [Pontibacter sp. FD36]SIQ66520.1 hypothetical protein SAMN05421545_0954 [Pontibacter lucknowensis]